MATSCTPCGASRAGRPGRGRCSTRSSTPRRSTPEPDCVGPPDVVTREGRVRHRVFRVRRGAAARAGLVAVLVAATATGASASDLPAPGSSPAGERAAAPAAPAVLSVSQVARQDVPALRGSQPDTVAEPDVAVSPRDPRIAVAVAQDGRYPDGGAVGITYAWTHDGGRHWRPQPLPGLTPVTGGSATYRRASDPVAAFDLGGRAYVSMLLVTKRGPSAVAV